MTATTATIDTSDHDTYSPDLTDPLTHDITHFPTITPRTETYVVR